MVCKAEKKPRKFTAKDVKRIIETAKLNDSTSNICKAINESNAKEKCQKKIKCAKILERVQILKGKLIKQRGNPTFDPLKNSIQGLTEKKQDINDLLSYFNEDKDKKTLKFFSHPLPNPNNDPIIIDDQGNLINGSSVYDPSKIPVEFSFSPYWILYRALKVIYGLLSDLGIIKPIFNLFDPVINLLNTLETWLKNNCE
jgi:hypothetical protein